MYRKFRLLKSFVAFTVAAMTIGFISAFLGGTTVLAAPEFVEHYGIWIGGTELTSENANHCPNVTGGTITYDPLTHILTLDNVTGINGSFKKDGHAYKIYSDRDYLTINLIGDNSFTDLGDADVLIGKYYYEDQLSSGFVILRGYGTLNVSGSSSCNAVYASGGAGIALDDDVSVSSNGCCFYSENDIKVVGNVTASSSSDNVFFAKDTICISYTGSVTANVTDLSSSSYPLKAKDIDIDDTRSITGISINDPSVITRFPNVEIAEDSGYKSIYSLDENAFVKGVIIGVPEYLVDLNVSTLDVNGNPDASAVGGTATVDKTSGVQGDKITVTATPGDGYRLKSVLWGDGVTSTDITDTNEFVIEDFDISVVVVFEKIASDSSSENTNNSNTSANPTYTVIKGSDSEADGTSDVVIEVQRSVDDENCLDYFDSVAVDGTKLTDQYSLSKGSTIVTIKSDYLKTLSEGKHTITVYFKDNSVSTTITIKAVAQSNGANIPSTGEVQSPVMYLGIAMVLIACGVIVFVGTNKRKEET